MDSTVMNVDVSGLLPWSAVRNVKRRRHLHILLLGSRVAVQKAG
jgi:hypothetical protein